MKRFFRAILGSFFVLSLFIIPAKAQLEPFGLAGERINALTISPPPLDGLLLVAVDSSEVFLKDLFSFGSPWNPVGLAGKKVRSLSVQIMGVGYSRFIRFLAGVRPERSAGDSTLLYQTFAIWNPLWLPADSGLDAGSIAEVIAIAAMHYEGFMPEKPVFISAGGKMYRSTDPGNEPWENIGPASGPAVINVYQAYPGELWSSPEIVWIGGETLISRPFLAKSTDYGNSWEFYYPDLSGDNACNSIAIASGHPDTVYAGMEGAVIKTTDGGQNWLITSLQNTPYYFYGIVANPLNPNHVVAGGVSNTGLSGLYETHDGGANWEELQLPLAAAGVSGLAGHVMGYDFMVYIGTFGDGVYRYITSPVGLGYPPLSGGELNFILEQNYPNPFNSETTIGYQLSPAGAGEVELSIYNLRGQKVRTLVRARQPAGRYQAKWDGRDDAGREAASGVYICQLRVSPGESMAAPSEQAGNFVQSRLPGAYSQTGKMLLLR